MQFKTKYAQQSVRIGDTRVRRVFAWLPKRIQDVLVWLESYEVREYYELREYPLGNEKIAQVYEWVPIGYRVIVKEVKITQE